jgi:anaerobic selenocysteine-containing dehydrogenase
MAWIFPRLTRRSFLKLGAVSAAASPLLTSAPVKAALFEFAHPKRDQLKAEVHQTICHFCSSLCNVNVKTLGEGETKRIVKLDGNTESTLNRGRMCARGQSGLYQTYDTDRLKTPLIRVEGSKRGEMKFRAASWEEAWKYIADKKKEAKIQPWEWTSVGGWTSCVFYMNWAVPFAVANQIPNLIASPMQHCVTTGHLGTDVVTGNFNIHDEILPDYENARYIMFVANNGSLGAVSTCRAVRFAAGKKKGAKVVALDPRLSETSAKADEWVSIRPGTDLDFMLAMLHEMMTEGYFDHDFVRTHTNLPFLVYRDDKQQWQLLKDANGQPYTWDETSNAAVAMKAFANSNTVDAADKHILPAMQVAEGTQMDGKAVQTVFQAQLAEIKDFTPEWAEKSTGIEAARIRRIAKEFGTTRPSLIDPGWMGARYNNIQMLRRVQAMVQTLVGGIDTEGGWIMSSEYRHKATKMLDRMAKNEQATAPLVQTAGLPFAQLVVGVISKGENFAHGKPGWAWAWAEQQRAEGKPAVALPVMADTGFKETVEGKLSYKGEKYLARALFVNAANPVHHYFPDSHWKEILTNPAMELVVVSDVLPSDTTAYADVILPNSTYLERDEPAMYGNGVNHDLGLTTRYRAIDPLYDTWETPDIMLKMSEIISGSGDGFIGAMEALTGTPAAKVKEELGKLRAAKVPSPFSAACRKVNMELAAEEVGMTAEQLDGELRRRGVYLIETKEELLAKHSMPRHQPVPTGSGRLEFFSSFFDGLRGMGVSGPNFNVLAGHVPNTSRSDKKPDEPLADNEFYFTYGKSPTVSHGSTNVNNPILAGINRFKKDIYTGIWIHPERANKLGIASGDLIEMENMVSGQKARGKAHVTNMIQHETVFMYSSFGTENPALTRAAGFGVSINKLIPYQIDPVVAGFRSQEFTLRIKKVEGEGVQA